MQPEERLARPRQLGVQPKGALGKLTLGLLLVLTAGLEEQASQAELLGVGRRQHCLEDAPRRRLVAGELRCLSAQQVRQRLVGQRLACLKSVARSHGAVAGTDGDHAGGERVEPAPLAPFGQEVAEGRGAGPNLAHQRPDHERQAEDTGEDDDGAEHARLDLVVLPGDEEGARPVGQPGEASRECQNSKQKKDDTQHLATTSVLVLGARLCGIGCGR